MAVAIPKKKRAFGDSYFDLVKSFPLVKIRTKVDHERAVEIVNSLAGRKLDNGSSEYLDSLIVFVTKYEDENEPIDDFASPQDALKALMNANSLSQADIGKIIGSDSTVSMFFKGDRELSKKHIKLLADRFKVDAGIFL